MPGDDTYRALAEYAVEQIDDCLDRHGIREDDVGILAALDIDEEADPVETVVSYHVRPVDGPYDGQVSADFAYRFSVDVVDACTVRDEIYPMLIETVEAAYPRAEVQYHEPDGMD